MSTISGKNPDGSDWIQYTSLGPKFEGRFHYGARKEENYFRVWRDDQSRAFECGSFEEVQSIVMAWTMEAWHEPRWDVIVHNTLMWTRATNAWIECEWTEDKAKETAERLREKHPDRSVSIRRVEWEEYSKQ